MEEEARRRVEEVFGKSSSESDGDYDSSSPPPGWESVENINGLWLYTDFLSSHQHSLFLSSVLTEGWFADSSHNQAMSFGDLPPWATDLSDSIYECVCRGVNYGVPCFPNDLLHRCPLFDQIIVNLYQPGEGIQAHVDLMRFEDGIAIVSLESACVMHFTENEGGVDRVARKTSLLLKPGSLLLLWGEARYEWKHEIDRAPGAQLWEGHEICQKRRISITLRKLSQCV